MNTIGNTNLSSAAMLPKSLSNQVQGNAIGNQPKAEGTGSFKDMLMGSIQDVNQMQQQADKAVESMMTGGDTNPAEVLTAVQKADLAFRLMMQMRNKMMQVYQEVKEIRV